MGQRDHGLDDRQVCVIVVEPTHKRAIDLDRVERQVLQVSEGRIAGSEVIEDEQDAELAQGLQGPGAGFRLVHQDRLGDLQLEQVSRQARFRQDRRDLVDEVRLGELPSRQVDAHDELGIRHLVVPGASLAAGRLEDPPP